MGDKPAVYIERVYSVYEAHFNGDKPFGTKILDDELAKLYPLQNAIDKWVAKVLQEAGIGQELNEVENIRRQVSEVVSYLEELLCEAMLDPKGLIDAHHSRTLRYQRQ